MSNSLLVEFYNRLPEARTSEDPEKEKRKRKTDLEKFKASVEERYSEGTLLRLLSSPHNITRRAAVLALGLVGTMESNPALAVRLHDEDADLARMAADAMWSIWFRGDSPENVEELHRLVRLRDREKALSCLDHLVKRAPEFAEAFNQRAVVLFRLKQFERSIADCERTLQLNPFHFGAQAGMGQGLLQLRKHRAALKAFRNALRTNPQLEGIAETIRSLEKALGEEGRRDDKK
jgi:tetratricopeptide (TPR) repeat protein